MVSCTMGTVDNNIRFDFGSSPKLAALFAGRQPGDEITVEIVMVLKSQDSESATGRIVEVSDVASDDANGDGGSKAATPSDTEKMAIEVMRTRTNGNK